MSPKKNPSTSAKRAREAQQAGATAPYTELLRADLAEALATHTTAPGGSRMPLAWSPSVIVGIDERYDTEYADSRSGSRYATYVKQNQRDFDWTAYYEEADPVRFAITAWRTATGPVMSPGYVRLRPDLHAVEARRDDWDGGLFFTIDVPLRHGQLAAAPRLPRTWQDWQAVPFQHGEDYRRVAEPEYVGKTPTLLTTATLQLPAVGWPLLTPTATSGPELVREATAAVRLLVDRLNAEAGPLVARLLGDEG